VKSARPGFGFPPAARLHRPDEFRVTLRSRRRNRGVWFTVSTAKNASVCSRLGIVIPRRLVAKAVHRNRLKRLVRETFRQLSPPLPPLDLVVQVHAAPPASADRRALRDEVIRLLEWART